MEEKNNSFKFFFVENIFFLSDGLRKAVKNIYQNIFKFETKVLPKND